MRCWSLLWPSEVLWTCWPGSSSLFLGRDHLCEDYMISLQEEKLAAFGSGAFVLRILDFLFSGILRVTWVISPEDGVESGFLVRQLRPLHPTQAKPKPACQQMSKRQKQKPSWVPHSLLFCWSQRFHVKSNSPRSWGLRFVSAYGSFGWCHQTLDDVPWRLAGRNK